MPRYRGLCHLRASLPFQEFSVEHINYLSAASLASLASAAGFTGVALECQTRSRGEATHSSLWCTRSSARVRKVAPPPRGTPSSEAALLGYIEESERIEAQVRKRIQELANQGRPVLVRGVGTHTRHLLRSGALDGLTISAWVDSDLKLQGKEMRGVPVIAPEAVKRRLSPSSCPAVRSTTRSRGKFVKTSASRTRWCSSMSDGAEDILDRVIVRSSTVSGDPVQGVFAHLDRRPRSGGRRACSQPSLVTPSRRSLGESGIAAGAARRDGRARGQPTRQQPGQRAVSRSGRSESPVQCHCRRRPQLGGSVLFSSFTS